MMNQEEINNEEIINDPIEEEAAVASNGVNRRRRVDDSLSPVSIMMDELESDDFQRRLDAVRKLHSFAEAVGPERTRTEILPFLSEIFQDQEDILIALAIQLGNFVRYVGGPEFAHHLLHPLESLVIEEDNVVREKALESLKLVAAEHSTSDLERHFVPLIQSLALDEGIISRTSACELFSFCYPRVGPYMKAELRNDFRGLCDDGVATVRRAAVLEFGRFIEVIENEYLKSDFIHVFVNLMNDSNDTVRLSAIEICPNVATLLDEDDIKCYVLPNFRDRMNDVSWRVRSMIASTITDLQKIVGYDMTRSYLLLIFLTLLRDIEVEVRTMIAGKVTIFCQNLDPVYRMSMVMSNILPLVKPLAEDPSDYVKASLAKEFMGLCSVIGKTNTIEHLLPLFSALLKEKCPDVRFNIISSLEIVKNVVGIEQLSKSLIPVIDELAEDKVWRIRLDIAKYMPLIATQMEVEFFNEKFNTLCMSWLVDQIFAIREAASLNLKKFVQLFGHEWAKNIAIPKILFLSDQQNYRHRMTFLFCINSLADVCNPDSITELVLPVVLNMANDNIPNVKFNVAKTLQKIGPLLKPDVVRSQVRPVLQQLITDEDSDVQQFASGALEIIDAIIAVENMTID